MHAARALVLSVLVSLALIGEGAVVSYSVNDTSDAHDANTLDGVCQTSTPGHCTLRAAIEQANASPAAVVVPAGHYTLSLGEVLVTGAFTVSGAGLTRTFVAAGPSSRLFSVSQEGAALTLEDMTLTGGSLSTGAGGGVAVTYLAALTMRRCLLRSCSAPSGGGVFAAGPITLEDSVVYDCHATAGTGGAITFVASADGLAVASLNRVTLWQNVALGAGGAIYFPSGYGTLGLVNTTVSGNHSGGQGGGLRVEGSDVTLEYVTVTDNYTDTSSGGGGISSTAAADALHVFRGIVSANYAASGDVLLDSQCAGSLTVGNAIISPAPGPICTIVNPYDASDPLLGLLQNNGGYGPTHALLAGSPAINADNCASRGTPITIDQRGVTRVTGAFSMCDLGAYEKVPCGDVNGDGATDVTDVFYLVNYLFAGGAVPPGFSDVNGDHTTDVADVFFLVNRLFAGGPAPTCPGT